MDLLLCAIFFLSGAAALLFENLWFHQSGLALGNTVWASSLVLAGFMTGLALGNGLAGTLGHRVRRRILWYAGIELAIGASGLALVHALPILTPLLAPALGSLLESAWQLNLVRLAIAFVLLVVPSTAMGATLPLLVAELFARDPRFGRALGRLYGWNTLGAVVGTLAGPLLLIEHFGIRGTGLVAASLNVASATAALGLAAWARAPAPVEPAPVAAEVGAAPIRLAPLLAAAALSGAIVLALEVVWFRFLLLFVLGNSLAFAWMLAIVLAGIALGSLIAATASGRRPHGASARRLGLGRSLPVLALISATLCALSYALLDLAVARIESLPVSRPSGILALGIPLMFPIALLSGALFTLLGEAIQRVSGRATRSAGMLALANTLGAALGSLAGGFVLLPALGVERSVQLLAAAYVVVAACLVLGGLGPRRPRGRAALAGAGVATLLLAALAPVGRMEERFLQYPIRRFTAQEPVVPVLTRESLTETILLLRRDLYGEPIYYRLVTNSHSMTSSALTARRYMQGFVYLPVALHPDPRDALLISYGVGMTARALTETRGLERIDVVDVSRDILSLDSTLFPNPEARPLADPRVSVHVEDGRHFLQTTARRYDLITGEPPPPKAAGIVNLFTREYFELLRARLTEGGIATYWLPVHGLWERETRSIIAAFCAAFSDCTLWSGYDLDWMLVGTRGAKGPVPLERFTRQWRDPRVGPELRALGIERPEQLGAMFLAGATDLAKLVGDAPILDDDHPKRIGDLPPPRRKLRDMYDGWMDPELALERFRRSDFVERIWPESLRAASEPYFAWQPLLNRGPAGGGGGAGARLERVHRVLTGPALETLAHWQLGRSHETLTAAEAARSRGGRGPGIDFETGVSALSRRDYGKAAERLGRAHAAGKRREALLYQVYALCLGGRTEEAAAAGAAEGVWEIVEPICRAGAAAEGR